jgi:hypothetical protein
MAGSAMTLETASRARLDHAGDLADDQRLVGGEVDDAVGDHALDGVVGERNVLGVTLTNLAAPMTAIPDRSGDRLGSVALAPAGAFSVVFPTRWRDASIWAWA